MGEILPAKVVIHNKVALIIEVGVARGDCGTTQTNGKAQPLTTHERTVRKVLILARHHTHKDSLGHNILSKLLGVLVCLLPLGLNKAKGGEQIQAGYSHGQGSYTVNQDGAEGGPGLLGKGGLVGGNHNISLQLETTVSALSLSEGAQPRERGEQGRRQQPKGKGRVVTSIEPRTPQQ